MQHTKPVLFRTILAFSLVCVFALLPVSAQEAVQSEAQLRQLDFANSLFLRQIYDMAAVEYEKFVNDFPKSASREYALFQWAESLYNRQDFDKASAGYQTLLEEYPTGKKRRLSLLRLGEISYRAERYNESENLLTLLLAEKPAPDVEEMALYHLGATYLAQERFPLASKTFKLQLEKFPDGIFAPFAKLGLGSALKSGDDYKQAMKLWQEVVDQVGDSKQPRIRNLAIEALYRLGETYDTLGQYSKAAETFASLAERYPDSPLLTSSLYREAWAWLSAKQGSRARQQATLLLEQTALPDLDRFRAGTNFLIGLSFFEDQNYEAAIASFQKVLALDKTLNEWDVYAPKALSQIVWSHFLKGDYASAHKLAAQFEKDFKGHPLSGDIQFVKGESFFRLEQYQLAFDEYRHLTETWPNSSYLPESLFKMGQCQMKLKKYEQAAKIFAQFLQRLPKDSLAADASLMEAECLFAANRNEEAAQAYQTFLRTYKDHAQTEYALYKLSLCYRSLEQFDKLSQVCTALIQKNPKTTHRDMALFWIAYRADRTDQAEKAQNNYIALLNDYPKSQYAGEARLRLAMLYYRNDKAKEAAQQFTTLIQDEKASAKIEPSVYFWTADQLIRQDRLKEAIEIYQTLADRFPRGDVVEESLFHTAQCFFNLGNWAKAATNFNRLIKEYPDSPFFERASLGTAKAAIQQKAYNDAIVRLQPLTGSLDTEVAAQAGLALGDALALSGMKEDAVAAYLRVAFLYDHKEIVPEAYEKAIRLLVEQGQQAQAKKHFNELVKLYPNSAAAAEAAKLLTASVPQAATPEH